MVSLERISQHNTWHLDFDTQVKSNKGTNKTTSHQWPIFCLLYPYHTFLLQILFLTSLYELKILESEGTIKHYCSQGRPAWFLGETDGWSRDLRVLFLFLHFRKGFSKCNDQTRPWRICLMQDNKNLPFTSFFYPFILTRPQRCWPNRKSPAPSNSKRVVWRLLKNAARKANTLYSTYFIAPYTRTQSMGSPV